jgi:hypothetical protein
MKAFLMTLATAVGVGFLVFFGKQMMTVFGKELVLFVLLVAITIYLFYMLYQLFLFNLKTARNK